MRTITNNEDYLAIIPIGAGSSWGRSPDKEVAIKNAVTALKDWTVYYDLSGVEITINVIDVMGYGTVVWDNRGVHGKNEMTGIDETITRPIEHVKRVTPKWKLRK